MVAYGNEGRLVLLAIHLHSKIADYGLPSGKFPIWRVIPFMGCAVSCPVRLEYFDFMARYKTNNGSKKSVFWFNSAQFQKSLSFQCVYPGSYVMVSCSIIWKSMSCFYTKLNVCYINSIQRSPWHHSDNVIVFFFIVQNYKSKLIISQEKSIFDHLFNKKSR
jgi:hypothetical protein